MVRDRTLVLALSTVVATAVLLSFFVSSTVYSTIYEENGVIEVSTALAYGLASLIALAGSIRCFLKRGINLVAMGLFAFFAFAIFLVAEEISVWTVFMSSEPPRVLGIRMDAAHDVLHLGLKAVKNLIAYSATLGFSFIGVVSLTSLVLIHRFRHTISKSTKFVLSSRTGTYILLCVGLGCAALVADLRSETIHILKSVEEGLELAASLSLLIAAVYAVSLASVGVDTEA